MSQQTSESLHTSAGRTKLIEDGLYANYLAYFRKAEDSRRWKRMRIVPGGIGLRDIPDWAKEPADRDAGALVLSVGE